MLKKTLSEAILIVSLLSLTGFYPASATSERILPDLIQERRSTSEEVIGTTQWREHLYNLMVDLFKREGMHEGDLEFVDDEVETTLQRYKFAFGSFAVIFFLMAVHSLFFYKKD